MLSIICVKPLHKQSTNLKAMVCHFQEPKKERSTKEPSEDRVRNMEKEDRPTDVVQLLIEPDMPCCTLCSEDLWVSIATSSSNISSLILSWMRMDHAEVSWPSTLLMVHSTESELIIQSWPQEEPEEPTNLAQELTLKPETELLWLQELDYQTKIKNSFNSIQLVFTEPVVY